MRIVLILLLVPLHLLGAAAAVADKKTAVTTVSSASFIQKAALLDIMSKPVLVKATLATEIVIPLSYYDDSYIGQNFWTSPKGRYIVCHLYDTKGLQLVDLHTKASTILFNDQQITDAKFSPHETYLALVSKNEPTSDKSTLLLLDLIHSKLFFDEANFDTSLAFSDDERFLFVSFNDACKAIDLTTLPTGRTVSALYDCGKYGIAYDPVNKRIAGCTGRDKNTKTWRVKIVDIATNSCLRTLPHKEAARTICFDTTGHYMFTKGLWEDKIFVWEADTGRPMHTLDGIQAVFSPDNRFITTLSQSVDPCDTRNYIKHICYWNLSTGALEKSIPIKPFLGLNVYATFYTGIPDDHKAFVMRSLQENTPDQQAFVDYLSERGIVPENTPIKLTKKEAGFFATLPPITQLCLRHNLGLPLEESSSASSASSSAAAAAPTVEEAKAESKEAKA